MKKFEPTPKMLSLLQAACDTRVNATITAWCKAANISPVSYYEWRKRDDFNTWFDGEMERWTNSMLSSLRKVGIIKALSGDYQFWRDMVEMVGGKQKLALSGREGKKFGIPGVDFDLDFEVANDDPPVDSVN